MVYLLRPGFLSLQCALNHAISSTQRDLFIAVNTYRQGDEQEGLKAVMSASDQVKQEVKPLALEPSGFYHVH